MQINQWDKQQDRIKEINHMITSVDGETALDKLQYSFAIEMLNNLGTEGTYFNIIKAICDN